MHDPRRREPLRSESFEALLTWLSPDRESAGRVYEVLRRKLIEFFVRKGGSPADELTDEVLDRVGRKLADGEVIRAENPAAYCLGVARMLILEYWRSPERKRMPLEEPRSLEVNSQNESAEVERRYSCLSECLHQLPAEDRQLMQEYYDDDWRTQAERRKQLARRLGIEAVSLRARASRIREKLEPCVRACAERGQK